MTERKSLHWKAFLLALGISTAVFLPFLLYNGGYFIFIGDFNAQQIPFYKLVHQAVREGNFGWSWTTDLGANFIASYSFYNLTSPFFWLTIPFPNDWVPFLMAPLLILKNACAALTSYFYLARFVRRREFAVLGSLLYSFSGFMFYNTFFNHFHEVVVFFPLLLIGMEELVQNNRRGFFAVAVALNAVVNYWFFIGSAVFCILYFAFRCTDKSWGANFKKFCWVAFEALLGMGLSLFIFLPAVLGILGNPRTTSDNLLSGWSFWLYWHEERLPAIVGSFLFPPHVPSRPVMFPNHGAKWSSLTAWLPLFGASGMMAYLLMPQRSWLKKMIAACLLIAVIPGLNSIFILLNNSYYTRWFYALILLMCLATVLAMERRGIDYLRGVKWTAGITVGMVLAVGLTPVKEEGKWKIGLASDMPTFWMYAAFTGVCLLATWLLIRHFKNTKQMPRVAIAGVCAVSVLFGWIYFIDGKNARSSDEWLIENGINGRDMVQFPADSSFVRTDFYGTLENLGMYWDRPTIQAFHSIVPVSLMEFYPEVGVTRDVSSKPDTKLYALRSLLSVRWLVIEERNEEQSPMPGYSYVRTDGNFNLYENDHFVPMGFAFDHYITRETFDATAKDYRCRLLMKGLLLEDDAIARHSDILTKLSDQQADTLSEDAFVADCADRRREASYEFTTDNRGFTSKIVLSKENLVFFSVPYDEGWSATVNGQPAQIEKVDIGFMAVRAPAGDSTIRFTYRTPGLGVGLLASGISLAVLAGYLLLSHQLRRRPAPSISYTVLQTPEEEHQLSFEELLKKDKTENQSQEEK